MIDATLPTTPTSAGSDAGVLAFAEMRRRSARERFFQRGATGFVVPALIGAVVACGSFIASTGAIDGAAAAPHVRHMFVGAFLFGASFVGSFASLAAALAASERVRTTVNDE